MNRLGIRGLVAGSAMVAMAGATAGAADLAVETYTAPPPAVTASMFDIAFGVTVTSEYISRGYSLSDGVAIQPFAELTAGILYVGYWGSNVTDGDWEHDLSIGIRPTFGPLSLDFGYVRYLYSDGGDCCGELYAKAEYAAFDPLTLGAAVYYDPENEITYVEGNAAIALPNNFSISGAIGYTDVSDTTSWNAGLGWEPLEWVSFDARYFGGPTAEKFVVSATFSSSLSALGMVRPAGAN